jgi:cytochrome c-type biogenesis protein CcmH
VTPVRFALLMLFVLLAGSVHAYDPGTKLPDAAQEARARDLFRELRCMVCQNQSIDESDAPLAKDLRNLVRDRVAAGESNEAIKAFLVERYGEFVLLKPAFSAETLILWGAPIGVLLLGAGAVFFAVRRHGRPGRKEELSASEKRKLDEILRRDA